MTTACRRLFSAESFERCSFVCSPESILPNSEAILWVQFLLLDLFQSSFVINTLALSPALPSMTEVVFRIHAKVIIFKDDFEDSEANIQEFSIRNISATKLSSQNSPSLCIIVS